MKKLVVLLMMIVLTGCFIACGKEEEVVTDNGQTDEVVTDNENTEDNGNEDATVEKTDDVEWDSYLIRGVYFDYPSSHYLDKRPGGYFILKDNDDIMVAVYADIDEEFNDSLEDVINFVNDEDFTTYASLAGGGGSSFYLGEDIVVTSSEMVTMAGMDSMKFEGTTPNRFRDEAYWDCYVYGYTFIINDMSYAVIGLVTPQEQDEEMIKQMKQLVDDVASTVRTEK